jgi:outer membrane cobalamin receptor
MKNNIFTIFVLAVSIASFGGNLTAQNKTPDITGIIVDKTSGSPLESATIQVFNNQDSSLTGGGLSDKDGKFIVSGIPEGNYYIRISYIGYNNAVAKNVGIKNTSKTINLGTVRLEQSSEMTQEIEVIGEAPVMTFEAGKQVYDAKKDLTAQSSNTLELLRNIPSVEVDNDGNVSLRGSSNVKILIDGKPSALLSAGTQVLQNIPANMVDKVEVITNPSAKYEAEGVSGLINIIMKENSALGYNGNMRINGGTQDKYNLSMTASAKKNKLTLTGSYSFWDYNVPGKTQFARETFNSINSRYIDQNLNWKFNGISHFGSAGVDYDFDKDNTLSFLGNIFVYNRNITGTDVLNFYSPELTNTGNITYYNDDGRNGINLEGTVTFTKKYEKKEKELTAFVNYSNRNEYTNQNYESYDENNSLYKTNRQDNYRFSFLNGQADFTSPFGKNDMFKLETGLKSNLRFINGTYSYNYFDNPLNSWLSVPGTENNADYSDMINALYANFSGKYKDFSMQAGLRSEHTFIDFSILNNTQQYNRKYLDFFPSISASQKLGNANQVQASYSRRINRPGLFFLNPFVDRIDEYTIRSGNPYLNPEYINSYELRYIRDFKILTATVSGFYRNLNNMITFITNTDTNGVSYMKPENRGQNNTYGLEAILQGGFAKWWTYNGSISYYNTNVIDNTNGINFDVDYYSWGGRMQTNSAIPDLFDVQLTYFYQGKQVNSQGEISPFQMFNLAVQKSILDKKLTVGLRVNDLFNQQRFKMVRGDANFSQNLYQKMESRAVFLTLTYNFGEQFNTKSQRTSQRKQREMEIEVQQTGN